MCSEASCQVLEWCKQKPPAALAERQLLKAGEAIRTPDIHVGNPQVSRQNMSLGVSTNDRRVQVLHLLRVDV